MSVYHRSDGRWCAKVKDESCIPPKWIQKTFKTQQEAEQYEDDCKSDSREGSRLTVFEAVALYLKNRDLSRSVQSQYRWLVTGTDRPTAKKRVGYAQIIANKYVDALNRRDLEAVRDCCRDGGCCNASINSWITKLCAAFNYAAEEELIVRNPWEHYRPLKEKRGTRNGTLEQFQKLYPHLPEWLKWACKTIIALCLRPGITELFRLKWAAFDWQVGSVEVAMGKVDRVKTVFPPAEYLAEAWDRFCRDEQDRERYVCRNSYGGTVHRYGSALARARRKAGVENFCLYALRHITATEMVRKGFDVAAVAANLGHCNPTITLNTYAHALPAAQKEASSVLGALWCSLDHSEPEKSNT